MTLTAGAVTLAIALLAAQGPRAAAVKRKKATSAQPAAAVVERRLPAAARTPAPPPAKRSEAASPASTSAVADTGAATDSAPSGAGATAALTGQGSGKVTKTKVYTFGAMDVEGKLKTPQLLYFLNRIKLELEMSAPDHRSFMKELERTADDPSL